MNERHDDLKAQHELRWEVADVLGAHVSGKQPRQDLSQVAERLTGLGNPANPGDDRWALAEAFRALAKAADWAPAVEAADGHAIAYRDASRLIAGRALSADRADVWSAGVVEALEILERVSDFSDIPRAAAALQRAPLVFPMTNLLVPRRTVPRTEREPAPRTTPTVLLHLTLNDEPLSWPMALQAGVSYRFGASAVLDDWPEDATKIQVDWESAVPNSILERTGFSIMPDGKTSDTGYLHARAEIPPHQGVDLIPVVTIHSANGDSQVPRVIGQRSLRITTFAPSEIGAGLPMVGQRIVELLAEVDSRIPTLPRPDRLNLLHLLSATARFAALAVERKELRTIGEKDFQKALKQSLAMDPLIGRRIQEGSKLGGGETDLVLERIVNELKVSDTHVDFESAQRFIGQPTQYASAGDCPISVLTVLDQSEKTEPPSIQSNYMEWAYPRTHAAGLVRTPSMVAIVIIPVGFPVPSQWSRSSRRAN